MINFLKMENIYQCKKGILVIKPTEIELRTENVFVLSLVTDKVYKTICDLMR